MCARGASTRAAATATRPSAGTTRAPRCSKCASEAGGGAASAAGRLPAAFRRLLRRMLPAAALLVCLAALAAAPGSALAAAGKAEQTRDAEAVTAATADRVVAAVLEGTAYQTSVAFWGGARLV